MPNESSSYYEERYQRIKTLWLAVFRRAAMDYALWKDERVDVEKMKHGQSARRFIFDESGLGLVCHIFDLPIEKMREWADSMTRDDVKKVEMLERKGRKAFVPETCIEIEED